MERSRELGLQVRGLMVVAPQGDAATRHAFRETAALGSALRVRELSMGMSDDLEIACEFGTTEVRVGRALFGPPSTRRRPDLTWLKAEMPRRRE